MKISERVLLVALLTTLTFGSMSFIKACGGQPRAMAHGLHEIGGGVSDHGQLVGLADDDHTAYYKRNEQATFGNVTAGKAVLSGMLRVASAGSFSAALFKSTDNTVFFDVDAFTDKLAYIRWLENSTELWSMYARGVGNTLRISPRFPGSARVPAWIYYPSGATVLRLRTATGVNVGEVTKFEIYSTGGYRTYQNGRIDGTLTVVGNSYFSNTSSTGNALVGGNVTVWGSSDTYGAVTAHGGITGLVSAAKRTLYVDFDAGSDSNGGTSFADAYATSAKVATEIPAIIKPFHNYSVIFRGTNASSVTLSNIITPSSGVYLKGQVTQLATGTLTSAYNPTNAPDGLSRISDGGASFGNYSGALLTVNSNDYIVKYTNTTSVHIYGKFSATPTGTYVVSRLDWIQNAPISMTNIGNFNISRVRSTAFAGNSVNVTSSIGTISGLYSHNGSSGQRRCLSLSNSTITATGVVSRANVNGFQTTASTLTGNYCTAADGSNAGYNITASSTAAFTGCDATGNTSIGFNYTNGSTSGGLFSKCRAHTSTTGISVDGNSYNKNISQCLVDGCNTGVSAFIGGQVTVSGATTINGGIASPTVGVSVQKHGGLEGYSNFTFTNLTTNLSEDSTSFGYADN